MNIIIFIITIIYTFYRIAKVSCDQFINDYFSIGISFSYVYTKYIT